MPSPAAGVDGTADTLTCVPIADVPTSARRALQPDNDLAASIETMASVPTGRVPDITTSGPLLMETVVLVDDCRYADTCSIRR